MILDSLKPAIRKIHKKKFKEKLKIILSSMINHIAFYEKKKNEKLFKVLNNKPYWWLEKKLPGSENLLISLLSLFLKRIILGVYLKR